MGAKTNKKVEERLMLETDNSCGICGFRDTRALTIHHINHESKEVDDSYDNLIVLCHNCHTQYHQDKGIEKHQILDTKRRLILKTLTPFGINALKYAYRNTLVTGAPYTLNHLVELGLLEYCDEIQGYGNGDLHVVVVGEYRVTNKGREFAEKWDIN